MANHIYIGSAKERITQYGTDIEIQLEVDDLMGYVAEYGYVNKAGKHVVRVKVSRRREVGKFGETHSVEINTWKPDQSRQGNTRQTPENPVVAPLYTAKRQSATVPPLTPDEQDELNQLPIPF